MENTIKNNLTNRLIVALISVLFFQMPLLAQNLIKGIVVDEANEPIIGATVQERGTNNGTITDFDGKFQLNVKNKAILQVSYIGYATVTIPAVRGKEMLITMKEDSEDLDEVVVIGYGAVRKSDLSGAVSAVAMKDNAETMPITTADQFLQGRISGVNITANNGAPGGEMSVQIRGISTLGQNTAPLYVVDGFPIEAVTATVDGGIADLKQQPTMNPLASINPNDIESIQVLKDASATAIYGSRATNGVIIITTKQGNSGKARVNYNFRLDVANVAKKYNLLNAYEYGLYQNELDRTWDGFDAQGNLIVSTDRAERNDWETLERYKLYSTDWQDLMYETAISQDHQIGVSGGNASTQFNVTAGYTNQQGIIKNTGLDRYSFRINLKSELSKKLLLQVNSSFTQSDQKQTSHSQASSMVQMVRRILTTPPVYMPGDKLYEDEDIEYVPADNPYSMATEYKDVLQQRFFMLNGSLTYNIGSGFSLKGAGSYNAVLGSRSNYLPIGTNAGNQYGGSAFRAENQRQNIVLESTLNYNKTFGKNHRIDAVVGYTHEDRQNKTLQVQAGGFVNNDLLYHSIGVATNTVAKESSIIRTKMSSFLGRVNYSLFDKYIITATGRYDGSSLLAKGNQWNFFPSLAVAWRINQENFLKKYENISNIKLRLSYGSTGNQNIGFAAPFAMMAYNRAYLNGEVVHGVINSKLSNSELGWEQTKTYNIGLDLGFFQNRFRITADVYQRKTTNMLLNLGLPPSSGYNTIAYNAGSMTNKGFEFEAGADILTGKFKWTLSGNIYLNRNNIDNLEGTEMLGTVYLAGGSAFNQSIHLTKVGYPVGSFYGYVVDGVYQNAAEVAEAPVDNPVAQPGTLKYKDISGPDGVPDGEITTADMTIIGSPEAKFNYGINTDLSYKGFSLSMVFTGRVGGDIANLNRYFLDSYTDTNNNIRKEAWEGRWQGEGTSNFYPVVDGSKRDSYFSKRFSTFLLEDGTYFRMKNVTLSYQFNMKKVKWINSLKLFATATNLFTITNYSGYDPEVSISRDALSPNVDYAAYPSSRTYSFGLNVKF